MSEENTVPIARMLERACEEMCNHYCKWPEKWDPEEHDGQELFDSEICSNCPLNRLA